MNVRQPLCSPFNALQAEPEYLKCRQTNTLFLLHPSINPFERLTRPYCRSVSSCTDSFACIKKPLHNFSANIIASTGRAPSNSLANMPNYRGTIRNANIPASKSSEIIAAINAIRTLTYDPALRSLLTDLEYERAGIEERILAHDRANNLYRLTEARMDLKQNRKTQQELAGLAEVEAMGWTGDSRRRNVDIACGEQAATGYMLGCDRGENGPRTEATVTDMFREPGWATESTKCCADNQCPECCPVSPSVKGIDSTGAAGRWAGRVAARANAAREA